MMQSIRSVLLLVLLATLPLYGCSQIGEAAGKAKAGIENAISDTKSGYNRGYSGEKSPSGEKSSSEKNVSEGSVTHL